MTYHRIFNAPRGNAGANTSARSTGGGAAPAQPTQGALVTPQSLTSFLGASSVVALLWKAAGLLNHSWATEQSVAFICALIVGAALYYISESDPARGPLTSRDYAIDAFVGFLNVLVLFSAAIGGTATITNMTTSGAPPPVVANQTR